jgi:hypothetical protein
MQRKYAFSTELKSKFSLSSIFHISLKINELYFNYNFISLYLSYLINHLLSYSLFYFVIFLHFFLFIYSFTMLLLKYGFRYHIRISV